MTLTEAAYYSRKLMPFGILSVLLILILYYVVVLLTLSMKQETTIQTQLTINPIFDKLSPIVLKNASPSADFTYTIDTIDGKPAVASGAANVYFYSAPSLNLGYRTKVPAMAKTAGIDTEVTQYTTVNKKAVYEDPKQSLTIDLASYNFTYTYKLSTLKKDDPFVTNSALPSEQTIQSQASDFLRRMDRYPEVLMKGTPHTIYFKYNPTTNELMVLPTAEGANMAEIDFYHPDVDKYPVVTTTYFNTPNYVALMFNNSNPMVVRAQTAYFDIATDQVGVYPLKTGDVAWDQLQKGAGYVVSRQGNSAAVTINKMFLGYLDVDEYQSYMQPVFVFLGENNFVAYVPAVDDGYIATEGATLSPTVAQ
jgi:hypothetical protein